MFINPPVILILLFSELFSIPENYMWTSNLVSVFVSHALIRYCCLPQIAVAESEAANLKTEASIESKALLSALYDVFLGTSAVSPSAKAAVAEGISKLP